jgi:23S rRNA pseudouridine2457 synthase
MVLSQFTGEAGEKTLADFITQPNFYPAGRLDKNSEGLLILTDDGALQHQLSHPKFNKSKHYWVEVEGTPTNKDLEPLRKGLQIKQTKYLPAQAKLIEAPPLLWSRTPPVRFRKLIQTNWLEIILNEGKNHQIRKMTAAIGFPTLRLIRHRIAHWTLDGLQPGEHRVIMLD